MATLQVLANEPVFYQLKIMDFLLNEKGQIDGNQGVGVLVRMWVMLKLRNFK